MSNPPGTTVGATLQAGLVPVVVKPTEPNNGGVLSNPDGKWDVWMGGKPKYDWSRLDINAATTFESPKPALFYLCKLCTERIQLS
jgi:hypothetical protein